VGNPHSNRHFNRRISVSIAMMVARAARRAAREALKKYKAAQKGNSPKVKKLMKKKGSAKDVKPVRGELTGRKKPKMTTRTKADMVRDQYGKDSISGKDMSKADKDQSQRMKNLMKSKVMPNKSTPKVEKVLKKAKAKKKKKKK